MAHLPREVYIRASRERSADCQADCCIYVSAITGPKEAIGLCLYR